MYRDMDKYEKQKQIARDPRFHYSYKAALEVQELRSVMTTDTKCAATK